MRKRNLIIAGILTGLIGVAGVTQASGYGDKDRCHGKGDHRGDMKHMMKELDLTKEQRQTFREIKKQNRELMENNREQMSEIRKQLREQVNAPTHDSSKVRELTDKQAKLMSDMQVKKIETMQQIRKQLTPEQQEEFDEMKEDHSSHRRS